jgi:hypothetical protein
VSYNLFFVLIFLKKIKKIYIFFKGKEEKINWGGLATPIRPRVWLKPPPVGLHWGDRPPPIFF